MLLLKIKKLKSNKLKIKSKVNQFHQLNKMKRMKIWTNSSTGSNAKVVSATFKLRMAGAVEVFILIVRTRLWINHLSRFLITWYYRWIGSIRFNLTMKRNIPRFLHQTKNYSIRVKTKTKAKISKSCFSFCVKKPKEKIHSGSILLIRFQKNIWVLRRTLIWLRFKAGYKMAKINFCQQSKQKGGN